VSFRRTREKEMKIYLAGPISGKGYDEVVSLYQDKSKMFEGWGYDVFCPMTGKAYLRNEIELKADGYGFPVSTNHAIFERDKWMVSQCDLIFVDLSNSGERVSIGTTMELAWASILGKHSVSIIPDGNIHNHAFVLEASDIVFLDRKSAYAYFQDLVKGIS
jgi:nucleoside 2-deoxyribosyltransferase